MDERKKAVAEYKKIRVKYGLPLLDDLEKTLGVYLEKPTHYYEFVLVSLRDRFLEASFMVYDMIQPRSFLSMMESKFFTEKQKEKFLEFASKCSEQVRLLGSAFFSSDKERTAMIGKSFQIYKKEVVPFSKEIHMKLAKKWGEKDTRKDMQNYFG
jgi:hypothetical protein